MSGCVARDVKWAPHLFGAGHRARRWTVSSSPRNKGHRRIASLAIGFETTEFIKDEHLHKTPISGVLVRELRAKRNGSLPPGRPTAAHQHSRRIRDGSRSRQAPRLHHAELQTRQGRHFTIVPLLMLLRVSTQSADGTGWMGGRLRMLAEFSETERKSLSWQKLQKDITADVVDWWLGVSVQHEKRHRGVSG